MRSRVLLVQKESLVEVGPLRNDHLLADGIVELPCLVTLRIPNEHTLLHVRAKAAERSLVLLNQHIRCASPNSQQREIRLGPKECLMGCHASHRCRGDPVVNMNEGGEGFTPE